VDTEDFAIEKPEPIKYLVYKRIKNAIIFDQLNEGEVLNERRLAELLQVSRTPVRQALELLRMDGWVVREGKSLSVGVLSYEEFLEMLPVRLENEKLAIRLAVAKLGEREVREMRKKLRQMERLARTIPQHNWERDKRRFLLLEKWIHLYFAVIAENHHLYELLERYMERFLKLGMISLKYRDDSLNTYRGMRSLCAAVEERELETAFSILESELKRGERQAALFLASRGRDDHRNDKPLEDTTIEQKGGGFQ
jgi:DNA-binding GntR family transcriptional regulator